MRLGFLAFLVMASLAHAEHRVTVNVDGYNYQCGNGGSTPGDPNCINNLTNVCKNHTTLSGSACFDKASAACRNQGPGYSGCVNSTTQTCVDQTTMSGAQCFEKAITACGGNADSIKELMESAQQRGAR